MRKEGKHPLSKVPHLGDPELDRPPEIVRESHVGICGDKVSLDGSDMKVVPTTLPVETPVIEAQNGTPSPSLIPSSEASADVTSENHSVTPTTSTTSADGDVINSVQPVIIEAQRDGETDQEYLVRTCR